MSQAKTLNCWKQFPHVSTVVQPNVLYLLKPANPTPSRSPCAYDDSTLRISLERKPRQRTQLKANVLASGLVISKGIN